MRCFYASVFALMLVASVAGAQSGSASAGFVVVVHGDNPATSVTRSFLADAFLKRVTRWPDDQAIRPVDLDDDSDVHSAFARTVLRRSVTAVRNYWQQIIFTGRGVPPVALSSDAAVIAYVTRHRGAVGYVSAGAELGRAKAVPIR